MASLRQSQTHTTESAAPEYPRAAIYLGNVVHKRLRPKPHALSYRVFALLVDVDRVAELAGRTKVLSYNRFNLFSIHDRDHGAGDGLSLADIARRALTDAGRPTDGRHIMLLTYPRVLGYVFNPLSVFYAYAPDGQLESLVYEVSNTFGERKSYVVAAGDADARDVYAQAARKDMYVSPFTDGRGGYSFRVTPPSSQTVVAVLLRDAHGALLKTHFRADRLDLTTVQLMRLFFTRPLLGLKVTAAIHYEAFKLWVKGVPLTERHTSPAYSTTPILERKKN